MELEAELDIEEVVDTEGCSDEREKIVSVLVDDTELDDNGTEETDPDGTVVMGAELGIEDALAKDEDGCADENGDTFVADTELEDTRTDDADSDVTMDTETELGIEEALKTDIAESSEKLEAEMEDIRTDEPIPDVVMEIEAELGLEDALEDSCTDDNGEELADTEPEDI